MPDHHKITPLDARVWEYVAGYIAEHGYAPSFREIGAGCSIAFNNVGIHLSRLEAAGYIERTTKKRTARGLRLRKKPQKKVDA